MTTGTSPHGVGPGATLATSTGSGGTGEVVKYPQAYIGGGESMKRDIPWIMDTRPEEEAGGQYKIANSGVPSIYATALAQAARNRRTTHAHH